MLHIYKEYKPAQPQNTRSVLRAGWDFQFRMRWEKGSTTGGRRIKALSSTTSFFCSSHHFDITLKHQSWLSHVICQVACPRSTLSLHCPLLPNPQVQGGGTSPIAFRAIILAAFAIRAPPWQLYWAHLFYKNWVCFSQVPQSTSSVKKKNKPRCNWNWQDN